MADNEQGSKPQTTNGKLTAVVGPVAAAALLSIVPLMESGRKVVTQITPTKQVVIVRQDPQRYTRAYRDMANVITICDGLTHGVTMRTTMSEQQCEAALEVVLAQEAEQLQRCTPLDKNKYGYQLAAFIDFVHNLGAGAWCKSSAAARVRAGRIAEACDLLTLYDKVRVHGRLVTVPYQLRRRLRERAYCQTGLVPGSTPANLPARLKGF